MGATTPSREDLRSYRQHLQSLADRLSGGVAQLTAEATRPTGAEVTEAEEPAQEPTAMSSEGDEEVARGLLMSEEQLLAEAREALARLDTGTFGRCEQCGRLIGKTRLQVVPYARRCIRCANTRNSNPVFNPARIHLAWRFPMSELEELRQIVEELTVAVHAQAKHLERTVERIEQSTGPLGLAPEYGIVAAETAALLVRLKKLAIVNAT